MSQPRTPHIGLLLTVVACLTLTGCGGDHAPASRGEDVSTEVDALFEPLTEGESPGATVMVIERGQVLHVGGYGYADLARRTAITSETAFRLASVSKQFAAMAIMILAERGQLDYDDAMVEYLPELERFGDRITLRHLLVHTSGLPDYYDALEAESEGGMPDTEQAMQFLAGWGEPLFPAGERYEYSNPGYEMLALVVERASGHSFGQFVEDNIFAPLGMNDSVVHDGSQGEIPNRALGYSRKGDSFELDDEHVLNNIVGSGGIYSTVEDLYLWDQALYTERLVQRSTLEEAWSPARLAGGDEYPYGFGWRLGRHDGLGRRVSHSGGWVGFSTVIVRYPERQFSVIVLSNLGDFDGEEIAGRITDIFFPSALIDAVVATLWKQRDTLAIHRTTVSEHTLSFVDDTSREKMRNDRPWNPPRSDAIRKEGH
jgi:CubicO group peptidase (beta-lactamase class C family)